MRCLSLYFFTYYLLRHSIIITYFRDDCQRMKRSYTLISRCTVNAMFLVIVTNVFYFMLFRVRKQRLGRFQYRRILFTIIFQSKYSPLVYYFPTYLLNTSFGRLSFSFSVKPFKTFLNFIFIYFVIRIIYFD